jgi:serine/threonine protein kinase
MNRQGVIHNDMKEDNILIRSTSPTIIDWGISGISSREHPIPEVIINRYISISNPFSSILFTNEFGKNYIELLKQNDIRNADHVANMQNNPQFIQKLRDFSLAQYLKNKEYGHYSQIQTFFRNVFNAFNGFPNSSVFLELSQCNIPDTKSSDELYHTIASNYISDVLLHFTEFDERDGVVRFQYVAYFTTTYIFNCDIWGTIFCYSVFFYFQDAYKYDAYVGIPPSAFSHFLRSILSMYMKQVMINGHEKINVSKLAKLVTSLI